MLTMAFRGHRAAVASLAEVILPLGVIPTTFGQAGDVTGNVVQHPMYEAVGAVGGDQRCVRVMADHCKAFGAGRRVAPAQRRRDIFPFTGMSGGNGAIGSEGAAGQLQIEIQGKTHGVLLLYAEVGDHGSADQGAQQPEAEQQPDHTGNDPFLDERADPKIDEKESEHDKGDAEDTAIDAECAGNAIDEGGAGTAEHIEYPGQAVDYQSDQGAEGLAQPFERVGIYIHRKASGSMGSIP